MLTAPMAHAEIKTAAVEYRQGETLLEGFVALDTAGPERRPGILVLHDWMGVDSYAKRRAEQLATLGYVAFAADIYGKWPGTAPPPPRTPPRRPPCMGVPRRVRCPAKRASLNPASRCGGLDVPAPLR